MAQREAAKLDEDVQLVNASGSSSVVLICEHASHFIPAVFDHLGLRDDQRQSHVAWDPGAMGVARRLAEVLDAAHIVDHARSGLNGSENGILLRSDIHDLFDVGKIQLDPESLVVIIDLSLKGTYYWQYNNQPIRDRVDGSLPSRDLIRLKNRTTG